MTNFESPLGCHVAESTHPGLQDTVERKRNVGIDVEYYS